MSKSFNLDPVLWAFPVSLVFLIVVFLSLIFNDNERQPVLSSFDISFNSCLENGGVPVVSSGFMYKSVHCVFK